tara:strand:+ start:201 stop:788 length:588 start_codon:yes stop_codon:yes gene_type:complete
VNINRLKTNKGNLIDSICIIKPKVFSDKRGFFYESWNELDFNTNICKRNFCQDNHSKSCKGAIRGIHYQIPPFEQGKLVRCTRGSIFDIAVDLRKYSATYKEWIGIELNDINNSQLWVPEGFGHGFLTLSEDAEVQYKVTKEWNKKSEKSILWNDPDLKIAWPLNNLAKIKPIISTKDSKGMKIREAEKFGFVFE